VINCGEIRAGSWLGAAGLSVAFPPGQLREVFSRLPPANTP
jgi:hypothetical protein